MYIGIDIGGMSIKAGVVAENGEIIAKGVVPTPLSGNEDFARAMIESVEKALKESRTQISDVEAIGIGFPGAIDKENGILSYANNVPCNNLNIREAFNNHFGKIEVLVDNDANCAALGEFYMTEGAKNFVFVTLGTGVGGGIIIDGKLYTGSNSMAGEIGHIAIHHGGRECSCGRKGCWEMYASVTGLIMSTEENRDKIKSIAPEEKISGRTVFEYAKKGDEEARRVRDEWIEEVAIGITDMVNIFQPDEIVIGGAISKEGDVIMEPIRKYVDENAYYVEGFSKAKLSASVIGGDAGIIGAAFLYRNINS